ncbi:hypothetical protein [Aquisphaera insulae]|uniref:hypothetical protein n=1 Tax=Aquisphaera insulae TaxID=2712864 RepID=UPI0013ECD36C|nr:hypothetical protein [Aquisphaera insulae]
MPSGGSSGRTDFKGLPRSILGEVNEKIPLDEYRLYFIMLLYLSQGASDLIVDLESNELFKIQDGKIAPVTHGFNDTLGEEEGSSAIRVDYVKALGRYCDLSDPGSKLGRFFMRVGSELLEVEATRLADGRARQVALRYVNGPQWREAAWTWFRAIREVDNGELRMKFGRTKGDELGWHVEIIKFKSYLARMWFDLSHVKGLLLWLGITALVVVVSLVFALAMLGDRLLRDTS